MQMPFAAVHGRAGLRMGKENTASVSSTVGKDGNFKILGLEPGIFNAINSEGNKSRVRVLTS